MGNKVIQTKSGKKYRFTDSGIEAVK